MLPVFGTCPETYLDSQQTPERQLRAMPSAETIKSDSGSDDGSLGAKSDRNYEDMRLASVGVSIVRREKSSVDCGICKTPGGSDDPVSDGYLPFAFYRFEPRNIDEPPVLKPAGVDCAYCHDTMKKKYTGWNRAELVEALASALRNQDS